MSTLASSGNRERIPIRRMLLPMAMAISIWGGANVFVLHELLVLGLPHWPVFTLGLLLALSFPAALLLRGGRGISRWHKGLHRVGHMWAGTVFISMCFFLLAEGALGVLAIAGINISSQPIAQVMAGLAACVCAVWAYLEAGRPPRISRISIDVSSRRRRGRLLRIVQISDLHLGIDPGMALLNKVVDLANAQNPDLIVLTGDIIDPELPEGEAPANALSRLKAPQGLFAVTGNHEYYAGVHRFYALMQRAGVEVLANRSVNLPCGVQLAGMADPTANVFEGPGRSDILLAMAGLDPDGVSVLLAHQPKGLEPAAARGVDLVLSGHTHAGQIFPFDLLVRLSFRYLRGTYRIGPETHLVVSQGTGYWGPPMRLFTRSELVVTELRY